MNKSLIIAATAAALFTSGIYAAAAPQENNAAAPVAVAKNSCKAADGCKGKMHHKHCKKGSKHCKTKTHKKA